VCHFIGWATIDNLGVLKVLCSDHVISDLGPDAIIMAEGKKLQYIPRRDM
jgi:hypothetical protein